MEIGASVGISIAPDDGNDPDKLLKNADMALYRAKFDGRDSYRFFEPDMDAKMQARRTMEIDLRRALTLGEFEVYYQPLITLKTEEISGFEALLRWHHPGRGMIPPLEFIPIAEEIGLIGQIGAWVLKQACLEAAKWPDDIHIAVNLSPAQFRHRAVVLDVVAALGLSGLPAHRLEIEITESVLLQDTQSNLGILEELRDLGVGISMDDFGTGYSSLAYLQKFSFHKIKIDRSFVNDLERPESIAIIRAVTGLGSSLGIKTTAEGVETEEQLETLKAPQNPAAAMYAERVKEAADVLGIELVSLPLKSDADLAGAFARADEERVRAVLIQIDPLTYRLSGEIIDRSSSVTFLLCTAGPLRCGMGRSCPMAPRRRKITRVRPSTSTEF